MRGYDELKENVLDKDLCTNCGTCIGVCPVHAISLKEEKIINPTLECIDCGKCLKSCPGKEFDFKKYNREIFGNEYSDEHQTLGSYKDIYCGYSSDDMIRQQAASGGIISTLLIWLLESKQVNGVVIIDNSFDNPMQYKTRITHTLEDVVRSAKSKYIIVPTNAIISELASLDGKYAYVGLPCQIHGLRKAMSLDQRLCDKIYVTIGLFCGFNLSEKATEYLLSKGKINKNKVEYISYREKLDGKIGFYAKDRDGMKFFINKHGYTFLNLVYSPKRCWMCYDYSSEFSDISVGDAWEKGEGWSRIILRTGLGEKIICGAKDANKIVIEQSAPEDIYNSQKKILSYKKDGFWLRKSKMKNFPEYNIGSNEISDKNKAKSMILYVIQLFGQTRACRALINLIPIRILEAISTKMRK